MKRHTVADHTDDDAREPWLAGVVSFSHTARGRCAAARGRVATGDQGGTTSPREAGTISFFGAGGTLVLRAVSRPLSTQ